MREGMRVVGRRRAQWKLVGPSQPATVRGIDVQMHIRELQLRDGICDALLIDWRGIGAERDVRVRHHVAEGIRLEHDRERQVWRLGQLPCVAVHEQRLVLVQPVVGGRELAGRGAGRAVSVGQVVQDELDDLLLASPALLGAGFRDGGRDVGEPGDGGDPNECAGPLDHGDARSVQGVIAGEERGLGLLQLLGVVAIRVEVLAQEGIHVPVCRMRKSEERS